MDEEKKYATRGKGEDGKCHVEVDKTSIKWSSLKISVSNTYAKTYIHTHI